MLSSVSRPHRHRYRPVPREVGVGKIVGGVISPILANIYLHELDMFLTELKAKMDQGKHRARNPEYEAITRNIHRRRRKLTEMLEDGNDTAGNVILNEL